MAALVMSPLENLCFSFPTSFYALPDCAFHGCCRGLTQHILNLLRLHSSSLAAVGYDFKRLNANVAFCSCHKERVAEEATVLIESIEVAISQHKLELPFLSSVINVARPYPPLLKGIQNVITQFVRQKAGDKSSAKHQQAKLQMTFCENKFNWQMEERALMHKDEEVLLDKHLELALQHLDFFEDDILGRGKRQGGHKNRAENKTTPRKLQEPSESILEDSEGLDTELVPCPSKRQLQISAKIRHRDRQSKQEQRE